MQSDLSFFFEIRSESLNKSAMSCCSFAGIYCCVYANVMNSAECSSSSVATMVQRAKLAYISKNTDLPLAAKKRQSEDHVELLNKFLHSGGPSLNLLYIIFHDFVYLLLTNVTPFTYLA